MNENNLCIYLINLDRAKERLNFVLPFIEGLGFPVERISAVDGRNISLEDVDYDPEEYLRRFKMYPEPGTIGCALSHMRVWELFMQSQYDYALIFEDDVQFDPEILKTHVDFCVLTAIMLYAHILLMFNMQDAILFLEKQLND